MEWLRPSLFDGLLLQLLSSCHQPVLKMDVSSWFENMLQTHKSILTVEAITSVNGIIRKHTHVEWPLLRNLYTILPVGVNQRSTAQRHFFWTWDVSGPLHASQGKWKNGQLNRKGVYIPFLGISVTKGPR